MVTASAAVGRENDTIHLITEVDITCPRDMISSMGRRLHVLRADLRNCYLAERKSPNWSMR
jgi:hypothetical protein